MRRLILLLFLLLGLAACTASNSTGGQVVVPEESTPLKEGSAPTIEATPTIRPDMHATDPATFVRAAGHAQFVEFFAFW